MKFIETHKADCMVSVLINTNLLLAACDHTVEDGYGWEKLFSERMCRHAMEDYGVSVRVPPFHHLYGSCGTYAGGREKAPAAVRRKVIEAQLDGTGAIEIWGDGEQTHSFTYIDDTIEGLFRILESEFTDPINLGSSQLVTINGLVDIVEGIAGVKLERKYNLSAPHGVRGRNSDKSLIREQLG
ncbi:MAG: NAD-dependent epimerase/dehydratase family protein [Gaiellaceae bacterium]